jgi:hypothetical protein
LRRLVSPPVYSINQSIHESINACTITGQLTPAARR